jgi:type II secretory pathway pseudopilin PulG
MLEVLAAIAIIAIVAGAGVPLALSSVDRSRAASASRYVSGLMAKARLEAVRRSRSVAIRFAEDADGYSMRAYADGNGNGVLLRDITDGTDGPVTSPTRLDHHFAGVSIGITPGVTDIDSPQLLDASDPIRIGRSTLLSFNPNGASTSGTLFIRGARATQFAVRIFGITGRTRILEYDFVAREWRPR